MLDEVERAVVGKREALTLVLAAILAKGHVLLEDFPGLGKTLAARSFAQALGLDFARAQFTPDLLPADLTGSFVYDQREGEFEFRRGPLFTGLLLADEINRTPPKTQAALLEAMQERQVTVEGETFLAAGAVPRARDRQPDRVRRHLPAPRGPARPVPAAGELRLPDRRPGVRRGRAAGSPAGGRRSCSTAVTDARRAARHAGGGRDVEVDESVGRYCVDLAAATREHPHVLTGSSPRGSLGLVLTARAFAVLRGRDYVMPEDVKAVARAGARAPDHGEAGAVDDRGQRAPASSTPCWAQVPTPATLERAARR